MTDLIKQHLAGSGIEVLSVTFGGEKKAVGFFTDGEEVIGLKRGIIMTSGQATTNFANGGIGVDESGDQFANNQNFSFATCAPLADIATDALKDVCVFQITFKPYSDSLEFSYAFASEEYPEYACSDFNDLFGFFLSGANPDGGLYDNQNIALIPNTNLPVAINNIHPYNPAQPNCTSLNTQYYFDNNNSLAQPVYDGFTSIFKAKARVIPCSTYVMTLAIADVGDAAYDSGVFLEARSFESAVEVSASFDPDVAVLPENAQADSVFLTFANLPPALLPMDVTIGGTAINGLDYLLIDSVYAVTQPNQTLGFLIQPLTDTLDEAFETVEFVVGAPGSCFYKSFTLNIADPDSLYSPVDTIVNLNGGPVVLKVASNFAANREWSFPSASGPMAIPAMNALVSPIQVNLPMDTLLDIMALKSVCINIDHDFIDDVDVYLKAPNGYILELTTDNGANGDDYVNTCFSPRATESIKGDAPFAPASASPFTGEWLPEGPWSDIAGAPVNGIWSLLVIDDNQGFSGMLNDWSISFAGDLVGRFDYNWNTGETSSSLQVSASGEYNVVVQNAVSSFTQKFVVTGEVATKDLQDNITEPLQIVPNPYTDDVVLIADHRLHVERIRVYDLNGSLVHEQSKPGRLTGAEKLARGLYSVVLTCQEGQYVQKMVKN
ncbi:MAG: choice-of-anchor L domain-containing protein [Saprospiraceae bacterium]|nr:choice-of-anchor L domain-containing protein [Saprospiraceae bacterium]